MTRPSLEMAAHVRLEKKRDRLRRSKPASHVLAAAALLLLPLFGCRDKSPQPQRLPTVPITAGARTLAVELARTDEQRRAGMMHRKRLGPDEGMLFVFPDLAMRRFYMKNTHVPLSIAFLRDDGVILNIEDMAPLSLDTHSSRLPCRYALEMPQGWFEKHGIKEGDRIVLPERMTAE